MTIVDSFARRKIVLEQQRFWQYFGLKYSDVFVRATLKDLFVKLEIYNLRFGNTLLNKEKSAKTILTQFD